MHKVAINDVCTVSVATSVTRIIDRLVEAREILHSKLEVKLLLPWLSRINIVRALKRKLARIERDIHSWIKNSCTRYIDQPAL